MSNPAGWVLQKLLFRERNTSCCSPLKNCHVSNFAWKPDKPIKGFSQAGDSWAEGPVWWPKCSALKRCNVSVISHYVDWYGKLNRHKAWDWYQTASSISLLPNAIMRVQIQKPKHGLQTASCLLGRIRKNMLYQLAKYDWAMSITFCCTASIWSQIPDLSSKISGYLHKVRLQDIGENRHFCGIYYDKMMMMNFF